VRLVVMSDGKTTTGRPDAEAAAAAAADGIAVDTVAFGTADGIVQFRGETVSVPVEPGPLSDIATATRGRFFETASADTLSQVFKQISGSLGTKTVKKENPTPYVAAGFVLLTLAVGAALALTQRFP
jgi:Ca-activated chloride channel family protein